jgi:hypothetical protein
MTYNWTYDDINKDIENIKKIINEENDSNKKNYYKYILNKMEEEYSCIFVSNHLPKYSSQSYMIDLNSDYLSNRRYYEFINIFDEIINNNDELLNTCFDKYIGIKKIDSYMIPDKKCVSMVNDVFMNLDEKFTKIYKNFYKNIDTSIKFSKKLDTIDEDVSDGFNIFISILNKHYILVRDELGIRKAINLAHECGHVLGIDYIPENYYNTVNNFFNEIPSLFFELIFEYESANKYDFFGTSLFNIEKLYFLKDSTDKILLHDCLIDEWKNNDYEVDNKLLNILNKKYEINRNDFYDLVKSLICDNGKYIIGYMVALNLFHIYKQDKNEAFKLLRTLLKLQHKDAYIVINQIINYDYINEEVYTLLKTTSEDVQKKLTLK